ncbi:thioesterase II family protein [Micromonospora siamensis]|uniref:Surfactin synthase thioesterase subunit n=1 Tax=Micromonospora siamensis TaxID=299152 RepID=A0A1C5HV32_9ACTN|nr:alpha/beta fold hydrolase [Micromonospora siamensis]SCG49753.1 Surfactin synthase thioesterase subunit [Micromonospora siamensis]
MTAPADAAGRTGAGGRWFEPTEIDPDATLRLFLFPHAGSGVSIYRDWGGLLPPSIAYQCVQLPGRQQRRAEPAFTEMEPLLDALRETVAAELDERPYAFFGHCMGAQLAYRLAAMLVADGERPPVLVAASGWAPEGFRTPTMEHARLPEADLRQWIVDLGSLPADVMHDEELLAMVIPTLRADLAVCATAVDRGEQVPCPVVSYGGRSDPLMFPGAMASWQDRTVNYLGNSEFPGGHFYIEEHALTVTSDLVRHLQRLVAAAR